MKIKDVVHICCIILSCLEGKNALVVVAKCDFYVRFQKILRINSGKEGCRDKRRQYKKL